MQFFTGLGVVLGLSMLCVSGQMMGSAVTPSPTTTPTAFVTERFTYCAFQAPSSGRTFNQSLFVSQCVTRINAICSSNPSTCGATSTFTITDQHVSIVVADITGGSRLPSNFPLSSAFPFQLPTLTVNPTFIALVNFRYPSGVSSNSVLPLGPTLEAVRSASNDYARATGFTALTVNGIDLAFLFQNRLIIYITAPIAAVLLCGVLWTVIIVIAVLCYKKKKNGKISPKDKKKRSNNNS